MPRPIEGELFKETHAQLVENARKWLRRNGCKVVLAEFVTLNGETPDALGWKGTWGDSLLVECKTSRADFLRDRKKAFRRDPTMGVGSYRYFMCPPGLIDPAELPEQWGLIYATAKKAELVHGYEPNSYDELRTFLFRTKNSVAEIRMLLSAIHRLSLNMKTDEVNRLLHATYPR